MKRLLSWIVLYLISCVTSLLTSLVVGLASYLLGLVNELNIVLRILIYIFGGTTLLSFLFLPIYYGSMLAVMASEAIKNTKKGMRYFVFSTYMLLSSVIYLLVDLINGHFNLAVLIMCAYYIALIILGREFAAENVNSGTTSNTGEF